ncbi:MAG: enoyl-CoA hydratase/isomerase family protein [Clostridia bacterium]|nr:enoyl-CoA hydratase/isomerase family protein [Clostridia bacterium]
MREGRAPGLRVSLGEVARVTIARPEVRNALDRATLAGLKEAFLDIARRDDVRVVVLSGEGEEAFCAGADLKEVAGAQSVLERRAYFAGVADVLEAMASTPQPVVAAVRGYALAGGLGLVAGADHAVAALDAVFALPEAGIGLFPMVVMAPLVRAVGRRAAWELMTTGRRIDGREAARIGLVTRAVPKEELDDAVSELVGRLLRQSPLALATGKAALYATDGLAYREALLVLREFSALLAGSDDAREGIAAFFERRRPEWPGR